jgi:hypothetical protein
VYKRQVLYYLQLAIISNASILGEWLSEDGFYLRIEKDVMLLDYQFATKAEYKLRNDDILIFKTFNGNSRFRYLVKSLDTLILFPINKNASSKLRSREQLSFRRKVNQIINEVKFDKLNFSINDGEFYGASFKVEIDSTGKLNLEKPCENCGECRKFQGKLDSSRLAELKAILSGIPWENRFHYGYSGFHNKYFNIQIRVNGNLKGFSFKNHYPELFRSLFEFLCCLKDEIDVKPLNPKITKSEYLSLFKYVLNNPYTYSDFYSDSVEMCELNSFTDSSGFNQKLAFMKGNINHVLNDNSLYLLDESGSFEVISPLIFRYLRQSDSSVFLNYSPLECTHNVLTHPFLKTHRMVNASSFSDVFSNLDYSNSEPSRHYNGFLMVFEPVFNLDEKKAIFQWSYYCGQECYFEYRYHLKLLDGVWNLESIDKIE